ncbi:MAG: Heavy metal translocating P-type ATPase [Candidatus Tokpelaia sp. JSC189]|nr:MAG: Heavy metal translocating P-type ATPase [Candidatus Tokpelaia sp. JSC189]
MHLLHRKSSFDNREINFYSGVKNIDATLRIRVKKNANDNTIAHIIELVKNASAAKTLTCDASLTIFAINIYLFCLLHGEMMHIILL